MRKILSYILSIIIITCLSACSRSTTTSTPSSDATISAMRFASNDSFPGLSKAKFTIVNKYQGDTGRIYNTDSIQYGTEITAVRPIFTYNATPYSLQFHIANDTTDTFFIYNSKDSIDFTQQPLYVTVTAQDRATQKTYLINPVVHQADPDLFSWTRVNSGITAEQVNSQNAFRIGDTFYYLATTGQVNVAYKSTDAKTWQPISIDNNTDITAYLSDTEQVYKLSGSTISISTDMQTWSQYGFSLEEGYHFFKPLFIFDYMLWSLVVNEEDNTFRIAYSSELGTELLDMLVPGNFPVEGFAAVTYKTPTDRQCAMLIGGYAEDGTMLNTRWSFEDSPLGYNVVNFSDETKITFSPIAGAVAAYYNDDVYLFGGIGKDNVVVEKQMLISEDAGMHWTTADTTHISLPDTFEPRYNMSVLTTPKGEIYLFGGRSRTETFSDVHRGILNSVWWKNN